VCNYNSNTVSVVDTATQSVTATINVGTTRLPLRSKAYVCNNGSSNVSVINTGTNTVSATISVGSNPSAVAITPDGTQAYVVDYGSANVKAINTSTNTVSATITVGTNPLAIAINRGPFVYAYVVNNGSNTVSAINTTNNTVASTISVGSSPNSIAISPDQKQAFVCNGSAGTVSVIDTDADQVTSTISVGSTPTAIAFSPDGLKAFVANQGSGNVSIINAKNDSIAATVTVGSSPQYICALEGGLSYVANNGSGSVSVIDSSNSVSTLTVGSSPVVLAALPDVTALYCLNNGSGNLSVIDTAQNNSQFAFDAAGRRAAIVELRNNSVTSNKQFVYEGANIREERDGSGAITKQYSPLGVRIASSNYFYEFDHLGNIVGLVDNTGSEVTSISYDLWGRPTVLFGSIIPDFGFAGMYLHQPSGLNLTLFRAYSSGLGRWLSRDPIGETGGTNLYGYVNNNPMAFIDPSGLRTFAWNEEGPLQVGDTRDSGVFAPESGAPDSSWEIALALMPLERPLIGFGGNALKALAESGIFPTLSLSARSCRGAFRLPGWASRLWDRLDINLRPGDFSEAEKANIIKRAMKIDEMYDRETALKWFDKYYGIHWREQGGISAPEPGALPPMPDKPWR
jgi:RHS repeat-associated protein